MNAKREMTEMAIYNVRFGDLVLVAGCLVKAGQVIDNGNDTITIVFPGNDLSLTLPKDEPVEIATHITNDEVLDALRDGLAADIFYDASQYGDSEKEQAIAYFRRMVSLATDRLRQMEAGHEEILPGAVRQEVLHVDMRDVVGEYESPDEVQEWTWVEENASFSHRQNGQCGVWEFVLNLGNTFDSIPEKLKVLIARARAGGIAYLVFHQGT